MAARAAGPQSLLCLLVGPIAACMLSANDSCIRPENVVRIDAQNERLFIAATPAEVSGADSMIRLVSNATQYIAKCHVNWGSRWSLSVFSDAKYAAYKDEQAVRPYVISGEWATAYLAEYDHGTKKLVRYPAQPEKRTESRQ